MMALCGGGSSRSCRRLTGSVERLGWPRCRQRAPAVGV